MDDHLVETENSEFVKFEDIPRYKEPNPLGLSDEELAIKRQEVTGLLNIYKNQSRQMLNDIWDLTYKMTDQEWEEFKKKCNEPPITKQNGFMTEETNDFQNLNI